METLTELISPLNAAEMKQQLLGSLQGVGPVTQDGAAGGPVLGTGIVAAVGPASAAARVVVQIVASGQVGAGTFKYSVDGGNTWSSPQTIPATPYLIAAIGVTLTFANGAYAPAGGSFQAGETYSFLTNTPTFPVGTWAAGSVPQQLVEMEAASLAAFAITVAEIGASGLVNSWINPPPQGPPPSAWLDLLAESFYKLTRIQATPAQGTVVLQAVAGAGPYSIQPGQLLLVDTQGHVFQNITGGVLAQGSSLALQVSAQVPGSAGNAPSWLPSPALLQGIVVLQTPLAGVSVTNPLQLGAVIHTGSGLGGISVAGTPPSPTELQVLIEITESGGPGAGQFTYSLTGGTPGSFVGPVAIPGSGVYALGATGLTLTFAGSFSGGDSYIFSTSWLTQRGSNSETDFSLASRCVGQWATLGAAPTASVYENWAKAASSEVQDVSLSVDASVPGQIDLVVIGVDDQPVSAAALADVIAYVRARAPLGVTVQVQNVAQQSVAVSGTVYVVGARLASVQSAVAAALTALGVEIGIAPATVYQSAVEGALQAVAGVRNIEGLALAGGTPDVALNPFSVAFFTTSGLVFQGV